MGYRYRVLLASLLGLPLLYVYLPTLVWLGQQWLGPDPFGAVIRNWSHGPWVVVLISYLLWRRRSKGFASLGPSAALALMFGGLALHFVGAFLEAPYLSAYSLIPVAIALSSLFFGTKADFGLFFPMLLFVLAVPFPVDEWGITRFLSRAVAIASAFLSQLVGVPVYRMGRVIAVGRDKYVVDDLCSGFNLIMALLALVLPLLYLRGASLKLLGAAFLWVTALGLATKVILVSIVLTLTPRLGQNTALLLYHRELGVPFFLATLGLALLIMTLISKKSHTAAPFE